MTAPLSPAALTAIEQILAARVDQVEHGHTLASDMAQGPRPIILAARARIRRALQDIDRDLQASADQTMGDITRLDPACQRLLLARLARVGALAIATIECVTETLEPTHVTPAR